ncbi:MAG: hypothetical protein AAB279_07195 [Candidatus Binatota bacterium]
MPSSGLPDQEATSTAPASAKARCGAAAASKRGPARKRPVETMLAIRA